MGLFEYKTHITHQQIDENNRLSDRGLISILAEAAGVHSDEIRI